MGKQDSIGPVAETVKSLNGREQPLCQAGVEESATQIPQLLVKREDEIRRPLSSRCSRESRLG